LIYIASQFSDPKEEEKYSKIFKLIDKDKDGKVTKADLYAAFLDLYKDKFKANMDSATAIKRSDFNNNGSIEYTGSSIINNT
jgi:Ca2+-binding EF-hand superfamily protein